MFIFFQIHTVTSRSESDDVSVNICEINLLWWQHKESSIKTVELYLELNCEILIVKQFTATKIPYPLESTF